VKTVKKPAGQGYQWADKGTGELLHLRVKTFYNSDYFDQIILPLLDISHGETVLDVGCGYGGLAFILAQKRPDLRIIGVDIEDEVLEMATEAAAENNLANLEFRLGDATRLEFKDNQFDLVVCQTLLTHVSDAQEVVNEMARVLRPGGRFMAAEYAISGAWSDYDNVSESKRNEAWHQEYFRLRRLYSQGKLTLSRGDEQAGIQVPLLATNAGLEVFDLRLNDRALHVIPPYNHQKQEDYLELLESTYDTDQESKNLEYTIEIIQAAGGSEQDAIRLFNAVDRSALRKAIRERSLTMLRAFRLYLTFANKPIR
jgi:SAM-dependent methyltransferase